MTANTVIAVCAVVIAAASLVGSVYEACATRKHNRYSVRPILELAMSFKDRRYRRTEPEQYWPWPGCGHEYKFVVRRQAARTI